MNIDYYKYLGLKMFLIEQIAVNNLTEGDPEKVSLMKEILDIITSSPEKIKERINNDR